METRHDKYNHVLSLCVSRVRSAGKNGDTVSVLEATCPRAHQITQFSGGARERGSAFPFRSIFSADKDEPGRQSPAGRSLAVPPGSAQLVCSFLRTSYAATSLDMTTQSSVEFEAFKLVTSSSLVLERTGDGPSLRKFQPLFSCLLGLNISGASDFRSNARFLLCRWFGWSEIKAPKAGSR